MLGNRFSFRTRPGDLGCFTGFDDDWKDSVEFLHGSKIHPFSIRESAPKRRVFLVGESSQNCWFFVWWFCCINGLGFSMGWVSHHFRFAKIWVFLFFGVIFSFSIFWPANHSKVFLWGVEATKWWGAHLKIFPRVISPCNQGWPW